MICGLCGELSAANREKILKLNNLKPFVNQKCTLRTM